MDWTTGLLDGGCDTEGAAVAIRDDAGTGTDGTNAGQFEAEAEAGAAGRDDGRSAKRAETTEDGRGPAGTAAPATLGGRRLGRCCWSRSPSWAAAAWPLLLLLLLLGWQCAAGPGGTDHCCNPDTAQPAE